jgi:hypothetical protein
MSTSSTTEISLGLFFHTMISGSVSILEIRAMEGSGDEMFAASPQTEVNLEWSIASGGESESSPTHFRQ